MTLADWIAAYQGIADQLGVISSSLTAITAEITALNSLATIALQLSILFAFVVLAYWRRTWELYLLAALLSVFVGLSLIGSDDWFIYGIFAFALGLFTLVRMLMSFGNK